MIVAAHTIAGGDAAFLQQSAGAAFGPYAYLGAKHMLSGADHLLYLVGVVFFLRRLRDVALYVSLFTLGHSITLIGGALSATAVNPYLIDAVIGLSVVYKGFENVGGFREVFGFTPDPRAAVLIFGLFHGLGLATRLDRIGLPEQGLLVNLLSFNLGVEAGQLLALLAVTALLFHWRGSSAFQRQALVANGVLMTAGFLLAGHQLAGYLLAEPA